ncbi:MAG: DNA polymerase III subunit beta [Gammaproteobacteria bacterium]|nr:DNA polymerase III subunit beta [Gammaproteobacteria bacterium]
MINFQRDDLLNALQLVNGVVERRQTLPILANVLLAIENDQLVMTATDLEIELIARFNITIEKPFNSTTIDCKKLLGIIKALPGDSVIKIEQKENRLFLFSGRSRFALSTLAAEDFPKVENHAINTELKLTQKALHALLRKSYFSMAEQDVRYYLNGLLLDIDKNSLSAIAADGHRLALSKLSSNSAEQPFKHILPRKAILELLRLLKESDDEITLKFGDNSVCVETADFLFTSKLIEGKFPDYRQIIPKGGTGIANIPVKGLKAALNRAAILTHQKHRGVSCRFGDNQLLLTANNLEHEEAEEVLEVGYQGNQMELGFNIDYLLDIVNAVADEETLVLHLTDDRTGVLFELPNDGNTRYVIMPMRL